MFSSFVSVFGGTDGGGQQGSNFLCDELGDRPYMECG